MAFGRRHSGGGQSGSLFRCFILLALLYIFAVYIAPQIHTGGTTTESHITDTNPAGMSWTILSHDGYYSELNCWQLRLHREWENGQETAQYCAKDKADYDAHQNGDTYTTDQDWMNNIIEHANPNRGNNAA